MKKTLLFFTTAALLFLQSTLVYSQVKFDADFESGNINSVTTTDSVHYEVTTVSDIGGRWFYFRIAGVQDRFISVNVKNSDCTRAMYSYDDKTYQRFSASESPAINIFEKTFEHDTVFVAYYTPYTFSFLQERISEWEQSEYVSLDTLGMTEMNLPVQEMIVTDKSVPDEDKLRVWIHSRTHPGETPSSYHFDGIMQQLLSDNEVMDYYRKKIIFYMIPFNNPDGVFYGRSRTNYFGIDQERQWDKDISDTPLAVRHLKERMTQINDDKKLSVMLNLHSQAASYITFWIHSAYSTSEYFYRREYQFSNLNSSDLDFFVHSDYRESHLKSHFAEGWTWENYGEDIMALTYETPYDYYSNNEWVTNENLYELGSRTLYAIAEYLELSHPHHLILDNKDAVINGTHGVDSIGLDFYSDDFYYFNPGNGDNSITYSTENLESGTYDIYAWWPSFNFNATDTRYEIYAGGNTYLIDHSQRSNSGMWNKLHTVSVPKEGNIEIVLKDNANGAVIADAFRIVYQGPATEVELADLPKSFELKQNYPNPFNPSTNIEFYLEKRSDVKLIIYNSLGEQIATLINEELPQGTHRRVFNMRDYGRLSSGVYYYQLIAGKHSDTKGMVLTK